LQSSVECSLVLSQCPPPMGQKLLNA